MVLADFSASNTANLMHGEHIIVRLTYISRYNGDNPNGEVSRILTQAQQNNSSKGITGALIFNHNYFLQSIEGARPAINDLLRKLVKDKRHFSLQVVECREVDERRWDKWSMKYLVPSEENKENLLKYSSGTEFNPYLMSTSQIMLFIDTLTQRQEQKERQEQQERQEQEQATGNEVNQVVQMSTSQIKQLISALSKQQGQSAHEKPWYSFR